MKQPKYIILSIKKSAKDQNPGEPLAYGLVSDPSPDMLLLRGGTATEFSSKDEAYVHLKRTLKMSTDLGHLWPKKFFFRLFELQKAIDIASSGG